MQTLKRYYFAKKDMAPNTFIGGVAATINTPALVASKLGILESRIKGFRVVGSDIEFAVVGDHAGGNWMDTTITYFNDQEGLIKILNGINFKNTPFLNTVSLPACHTFSTTNGSGGGNFYNSKIASLSAPNLTSIIGRGTFQDTSNLTSIYLDNVTTGFGIFCFAGTAAVNPLNIPLAVSLGQECFRDNNKTEVLNCPNVSSLSVRSFENAKKIKILELPKVLSISVKAQDFKDMSSLEILDLRFCKILGDPSDAYGIGLATIFHGIKLGATLKFNIALLTANGGLPDQGLVWAKANRASIVEFYDDSGNYVSTL